MNNLELFFADPDADKFECTFLSPTCPNLELNFMNISSDGESNKAGVVMLEDTVVLAELRRAEILGIDIWTDSTEEVMNGLVLVKNPRSIRQINGFNYGVKNALCEHKNVLYAGKIIEETVYIRRPILPDCQERLGGYLSRLISRIDVSLLPMLESRQIA